MQQVSAIASSSRDYIDTTLPIAESDETHVQAAIAMVVILVKFTNMFNNLTMKTNILYLKIHLFQPALINFLQLLMNMEKRESFNIPGSILFLD